MGLAVFLALVALCIAIIVAVLYGVCIGVARLFRLAWRALQPQAQAASERSRSVLRPAAETAQPPARPKCWEAKGCKPEARSRCPAFLKPQLPCWQATLTQSGKLRPQCLACPQFSAVGMVEG